MDLMVTLCSDRKSACLSCPAWLADVPRSFAGATFRNKTKTWVVPLLGNLEALVRLRYQGAQVDDQLVALADEQRQLKSRHPLQFEFKTTPFAHQRAALDRMADQDRFALFMEMGTGKTKVMIDLLCALYRAGRIDSVLVVSPLSVREVWRREFGLHASSAYNIERDDGTLAVRLVGVESLSRGKAFPEALSWLRGRRCAIIVDESSRIKNPRAQRTRNAIGLAQRCEHRYILTGTPITQGLQDLFSQFFFLDLHIIGLKSFFAFRNRYCVMGGFEHRQIIGYQRVDELMGRLKPHVYQIRKADALDLPPKLYEERVVQPTPTQKVIYKTIKAGLLRLNKVTIVLEQMLQLQQLVGGTLPEYLATGEANPKLAELLEVVGDLDSNEPVIIWCRFLREINHITCALREVYGPDTVAVMAGETSEAERASVVRDFQRGRIRFLVATPQVGGIGQTLTAASTVIYYSNTFSLEDRLQSEDRNHRIGQTKPVTYIDLVMDLKIDRLILASLRTKQSLLQMVQHAMTAKQLEQLI